MNKTDALIIGAGPTGLFTAHQLKLIGLDCEIVDNLDKIGGQCIELYPDKPIYDIPAVPECTGEELTNNLINQIKPFNIKTHLGERVDEVKKDGENWFVKTNQGKTFLTPNVIIAGGVGSFEPRKFTPKECEKFENISIFYSVKNKTIFEGKTVSIFGGGDSALDWAVELSKTSKVNLIHRRDDFRGAQATVDKVQALAKAGKIKVKLFLGGALGSEIEMIQDVQRGERPALLNEALVQPRLCGGCECVLHPCHHPSSTGRACPIAMRPKIGTKSERAEDLQGRGEIHVDATRRGGANNCPTEKACHVASALPCA